MSKNWKYILAASVWLSWSISALYPATKASKKFWASAINRWFILHWSTLHWYRNCSIATNLNVSLDFRLFVLGSQFSILRDTNRDFVWNRQLRYPQHFYCFWYWYWKGAVIRQSVSDVVTRDFRQAISRNDMESVATAWCPSVWLLNLLEVVSSRRS